MKQRKNFVCLMVALTAVLLVGARAPLRAQDENAIEPSAVPPPTERARQPRTVNKQRVFVWDLQGTWISKAYMDKLQSTRSPRAAARQTPALVVKIEKEGYTYPILFTNFRKAVLHFLLEVEPDPKPNVYRMVTAPEDRAVSSSEVTYIYFRGQRDAQGKFHTLSIADPHFAKRKFLTFSRLPSALEPFVNRSLIAGKYQDQQGRNYEFTEAGDAILPDRSFAYEVALDPSASNCDLLHSHPERAPEGKEALGFAWKGTQLQLFNVKASKRGRHACEDKAFAVLTPSTVG